MSTTSPTGSPVLGLETRALGLLPAGVCVCDAEGGIRYYNRRAAELWGREPRVGDSDERFSGGYRLYTLDGTPLPHAKAPTAGVLRTGEPLRNGEVVFERPDGTRVVALVNIDPLRDEAGRLVGAVNVFQDITREKRLAEEVGRNAERLRGLLSALPAAIYTTDCEGHIDFFNEAAAELWGRRPELGKEMWCGSYRIIRPEDGSPLPLDQCPMAVALKEGRGVRGVEIVVERPDGVRRCVLPHLEPLRNESGEVVGAVNMLVDITDRKTAEAERGLLAAIVESSSDIIASKTLDGTIMSWNKGAERVLGYTAEEVIGRHVSMLMPPDCVEDTEKILGRIRRGEIVNHYETRRRRKDGTIIDVSLTVSPVRDPSGRIVGASKVGRDVTERKRAEEELRRLADQLRETDRRKDEFLAMLAHELRNPLSAISSAVQVARRSDLVEPLDWSTEVIERQVKHLARLIDDLLDVSRITRGKIRLREDVVDIGPVLTSAVDTVRPLVEDRKHELSVSFGPGTLRVKADPVRLEQVVVNLLTNAAKYTPAGGRIWLTAEQGGDQVAVRVRDTGVGIPPEKLSEMFELFVQGDRSLARSEGGLGIGLTLVKNLVEMQGGSVAAASEGAGKGSEFTVRLPAVSAPARGAAPRPEGAGRDGAHASRILVVDDNDDSARGLARLLNLLGHEVRTSHDGREALAVAEAYRPDVVLLDIGLPGMDGYEVARHLRRTEACRGAVIVAVSGYGREDHLRRGREAGFDHHLVKPVDLDALLSLIGEG